MIEHIIPLLMVVCLLIGIFSGYPVTFVLGGVGILFAFFGGLHKSCGIAAKESV